MKSLVVGGTGTISGAVAQALEEWHGVILASHGNREKGVSLGNGPGFAGDATEGWQIRQRALPPLRLRGTSGPLPDEVLVLAIGCDRTHLRSLIATVKPLALPGDI